MAVMSDERDQRNALTAAGYTGRTGTLVLCATLAVIGALLGSMVFALLLSFVLPANSVEQNTILGTAAGVALGVWLGLAKVRRGNLEAREEVDDRQWRRLIRRQDHGPRVKK